MGKNASDDITTTSKNECQQIVNNFWPWIVDNQRAMPQRQPIIKLSAGFMGTNASDAITTTFWKWARTGHQLFWGGAQ